jgi:hypothetical protein
MNVRCGVEHHLRPAAIPTETLRMTHERCSKPCEETIEAITDKMATDRVNEGLTLTSHGVLTAKYGALK